MFGRKEFKNTYILSFIDHFHFIHPVDGKFRPLFWGAGHPVDSCRQGACTVGFDGHIFACLVQTVDQFIVYPLSEGNYGNLLCYSWIDRTWNENRDYLYPVPRQEITLSDGVVTQNPGWNE